MVMKLKQQGKTLLKQNNIKVRIQKGNLFLRALAKAVGIISILIRPTSSAIQKHDFIAYSVTGSDNYYGL